MLAKQAALKKARNKMYFRQLEEDNTESQLVEEVKVEQEMDPNAEILKPMTAEEKAEKKRALELQVYSMNDKESKMSKNKRKRLDKYIEHQLKREEKKVLLEKLSKTKIDTSNLASVKTLGKGKLSRKEEIVEALELERQGRGDDRTKEILYEEREVKEWDQFHESENELEDEVMVQPKQDSEEDISDSGNDEEDDFEDKFGGSSGFVDNRPAKYGGLGSGFGFSNIKQVKKQHHRRRSIVGGRG